ncbi:MAG TPA: YciI family protein [Polyangiaceae bacterium]|nr:YciI family protein [Polyangiaceae bacterium]
MAKFTFIFHGGAFVTPGLSPTEMQEHLNKWHAWVATFMKAGRHHVSQPLENRGKIVRGAERIITDGPFAESKDLVTGSLTIEAASLDEAAVLARDCPIYEFDGFVEVRPILELER